VKVDKLWVGKLFGGNQERFDAPLFQRPYVWDKERWDDLWDAVKTLADGRLGGIKAKPHFLGAIVLDQLQTSAGTLHLREVVDGQQRLTTLQVMIMSLRDFCTTVDQTTYAEACNLLTENRTPFSKNIIDRFKVWPTNADRDEFRALATAGTPTMVRNWMQETKPEGDHLLSNAYLYFGEAIQAWLQANASVPIETRLGSFYSAITEDLIVVVIDLESEDDSQKIFETLNSIGTPLLPADLVKNFLFRRAAVAGEDSEALYLAYWAKFDDDKDYWRKKFRTGLQRRARIDLFLQHYLTLLYGGEAKANQLFQQFRELCDDSSSTEAQMRGFREYSDVYRSFESFPQSTAEGRFFRHLQDLDTTTAHPLLLQVFREYNGPSHMTELRGILRDLESYLVRRVVCELETRSYGEFFAKTVSTLRTQGLMTAGAVRAALLQAPDTFRWPTNEEFKKAWMQLDFYKRLKKSKTRMILESIEMGLHTPKTEAITFDEKLTIEHVMPVEWERHWPIESDDDFETEKLARRRNTFIHRIGNLTLLTKSLNPAVSNGAWHKKRDGLKPSLLLLNQPLKDADVWDEMAIDNRSAALFAVAANLWKYPSEEGSATA
jgi:hypothetical protein